MQAFLFTFFPFCATILSLLLRTKCRDLFSAIIYNIIRQEGLGWIGSQVYSAQ